MVFLGGAVLANIVSTPRCSNHILVKTTGADISLDGRQARHVGLETGMGRTRSCEGSRETRTQVMKRKRRPNRYGLIGPRRYIEVDYEAVSLH